MSRDVDDRRRSRHQLPAGRRWAVRGLLIVATLVTVVAIFAVWANRQVLDADNWADTSTRAARRTRTIRDAGRGVPRRQGLRERRRRRRARGGAPAAARPARRPGRERAAAARRAPDRARCSSGRACSRPGSEANRLTAAAVHRDRRGRLAGGHDLRQRRRPEPARGRDRPRHAARRVRAGSSRRSRRTPGAITIMSRGRGGDAAERRQRRRAACRAVLPGPGGRAVRARGLPRARPTAGARSLFAGVGFIVAGLIVLVGAQPRRRLRSSTRSPRPAASSPPPRRSGRSAPRCCATSRRRVIIVGIPVVVAAWLAGPTRPAVALRAGRRRRGSDAPGHRLRRPRRGAPARARLGADPGDADGPAGAAVDRAVDLRAGRPAPPGRRGVPRGVAHGRARAGPATAAGSASTQRPG